MDVVGAMLLPLPGGSVVGQVCLFVCLVGSFVRDARRDSSKRTSPTFMKFGTDVQHRAECYFNF